MNITDLPSDFYGDRHGSPIRYIVRHTTQGIDSRTWLTKTGGVSAHYLVRGKVAYRLVGEELAAWHAGRIVGIPTTPLYTGTWEDIYEDGVWLGGGWTVNPNSESIGIEIEGFAAGPIDPEALAATVALIRDIRTRHDVPCVDHRELSPGDRTDPGIWAAAIDAALLEDDVDQKTFDAMALDWWKRTADQGGAGGLDTVLAMTALLNTLAAGEVVDDAAVADLRARIDRLRTI